MVKKVVPSLLAILCIASLFAALPTLSLGKPIGLADILWDVAIAALIVLGWKLYARVWDRNHATHTPYSPPDPAHGVVIDESGNVLN